MSEQSSASTKTAGSQNLSAAAGSQQRIAILMCTYNGDAHLVEQLDSIRQQSFKCIDIWVSDDGSSDNTLATLEAYRANWPLGRFEILHGPQCGFAANFLSLACNSDIQADFYAYSDQDDIWEIDKLSRAIHEITPYSQTPALYCSRTRLIAECGKPMHIKSPRFHRKPSFANALVQSIAGSNTMVFNDLARQVVLKAGLQKVISHDWWTYMLVSGTSGYVYYDATPSIRYRQHSDNHVGTNVGFLAKLKRLIMLLKGDYSNWNKTHCDSLSHVSGLLSPEHYITLDYFIKARNSGLLKRLMWLKKSGVYRQTLEGNIALWIAAFLNKI